MGFLDTFTNSLKLERRKLDFFELFEDVSPLIQDTPLVFFFKL